MTNIADEIKYAIELNKAASYCAPIKSRHTNYISD